MPEPGSLTQKEGWISTLSEKVSRVPLGRYLQRGHVGKDCRFEPTWFYGAGGQKITLRRAQTWVSIVPEDAKVEKLPAQ